ncbi:MAG TPA: M15 family metallopeptidase [Candidatus Saccharimonadales bacterium]|jgi:D-alanyl-D-alanine dipeptidase|nr:M15 family metallopeptidase [Candidatus Saccharimonadales bacterium]
MKPSNISPLPTAAHIAQLSPLERTRHYLGSPSLLATITQYETGEPLVGAAALRRKGLLVRPFWVDDPESVEGQAYQAHLQRRPDFTLAVRQSVAERLVQAQTALPKVWRIVLKAGLRPVAVQLQLLQNLQALLQAKHPEWSAKQALAETRLLVADPRLKVPPHATGGAIDIEVYDRSTNQLVDMGARANDETDRGKAYSDQITREQRARREQLYQAMLTAGFANNANEWWHFSYGDAYWALFYDQKRTLYRPLA